MGFIAVRGPFKRESVHRWLVREQDWLKEQTGYPSPKAISDAQLRRLLAKLDYQAYNAFNGAYFGWVSSESGVWHSIDGKELRGSIDRVLAKSGAKIWFGWWAMRMLRRK